MRVPSCILPYIIVLYYSFWSLPKWKKDFKNILKPQFQLGRFKSKTINTSDLCIFSSFSGLIIWCILWGRRITEERKSCHEKFSVFYPRCSVFCMHVIKSNYHWHCTYSFCFNSLHPWKKLKAGNSRILSVLFPLMQKTKCVCRYQ